MSGSPSQFPLLSRTLLCILLITSSSAHALEELKRIELPEPMPGPDKRNIGWEWHYIDQNGKAGYMRKIGGTETTASYSRTDGCEWTRHIHGFAPALIWSNCPSAGKAEVEFNGGEIWPIKVGNKFSYRMHGTSSFLKFKWSGERNCEITYSVRVKTVAGEFDSFKLVCHERWGTRTWWLSPEVGTAVAYQQKTGNGKLILQEMTKIVNQSTD